MKRWQSLFIGVLVSVFFLWIALHDLDWAAVGAILQNARWQYLLLAFGVWSLGLLARSVRWQALLGWQTRFVPTLHILNVGFLLNNTLPLRIGEVARAYLIGRKPATVSGWSALSSIVAERIIDMLAVVLMLVLVMPALPVEGAVITGAVIMGVIAVIGFVVLLVFAMKPAWAHAILGVMQRLLPFIKRLNLSDLVDRLLEGLQPLTNWRVLSAVVGWTAVGWFLSVAGSWVVALTFPDMPQTPEMRAALTLSVVAASFSIIIPFTIASVGPFEAAAVFALMTVALPQEIAVAYAVVWHTGVILVYAVWGVVGMLGLGLSLGQIQEGAAGFGGQESAAE
ncbi:lysylphosphatidylglycerol synthase transmembrane domain-containing protein [Chloroflexota bacterium]